MWIKSRNVKYVSTNTFEDLMEKDGAVITSLIVVLLGTCMWRAESYQRKYGDIECYTNHSNEPKCKRKSCYVLQFNLKKALK